MLKYSILSPHWNWLGTRGVGCLHRAPPPPPQALASGEKRTVSEVILIGGFRWRCRYCIYGGYEGAASPGHAKTSPQGRRKTVPRRILSCPCSEGGDTSGSENKTRLVAAGPPGWAVACVATTPRPGSLLRRRGLPGMVSAAVHALKQFTTMISSPSPTWRVKAWGPWQRMA